MRRRRLARLTAAAPQIMAPNAGTTVLTSVSSQSSLSDSQSATPPVQSATLQAPTAIVSQSAALRSGVQVQSNISSLQSCKRHWSGYFVSYAVQIIKSIDVKMFPVWIILNLTGLSEWFYKFKSWFKSSFNFFITIIAIFCNHRLCGKVLIYIWFFFELLFFILGVFLLRVICKKRASFLKI